MQQSRTDRRLRIAVLGAAVGVGLGILLAATTDIPFAPEGGLILGGLLGWFFGTRR